MEFLSVGRGFHVHDPVIGNDFKTNHKSHEDVVCHLSSIVFICN